MSGALSLTAITLNRLVGIMMPKLANILELNRSIVYCILGVIWLISFGAAIPTFDYRRYDVRYMFWACLNTKWDLYNVLICFRPHISRITHSSFVQRVSFVKLLNKILNECIPILIKFHVFQSSRLLMAKIWAINTSTIGLFYVS